jgi:dUTP pyrophosphatase
MLYVGNKPEKKSKGAAAFDLKANFDYYIPRNEDAVIRTGTSVAIPFGHFGLVTLRSGHGFKKNLLCHIGIIDSDYRGEIAVKVFNMGKEAVVIDKGERFAQLTILNYPFVYPMAVDSLDDTERGTGGFGSTGVK